MAQQDYDPEDAPGDVSGLTAMRLMMSGAHLPGQDALDQLAKGPIVDPANKWLNFAAGALKSTPSGRLSDSMANAMEGYSASQAHESELRAKYAPIIAQAALQRMQIGITLAQRQYMLTSQWDSSLTGAMGGFLSQGDVTPDMVVQTARTMAQQGQVDPQYAQSWAMNILKNPSLQDPKALTAYFRSRNIGMMKPEDRIKATTPNVSVEDVGGTKQGINTNPNAPGGVGVMPGLSLGKTLTPEQKVPKTIDTPYGPMTYAPSTGKAAPAGSQGGQDITHEALYGLGGPGGAPGPGPLPTPSPAAPGAGAAPQLPIQATPTPPQNSTVGGPGADSRSLEVSPDVLAANKTIGENFSKELQAQGSRVSALNDVLQRVGEMRELQKKFTSGKAAPVRMEVGAWAKDLMRSLGVPSDQAEKLSNGIAGGDVASMQAFQKLSVQGAMEALKSAMATAQGTQAGRATQFEYKVFADNSPNLKLDPAAMERMFNFYSKQAQSAKAGLGYLTDYQSKVAGGTAKYADAMKGYSDFMNQNEYANPIYSTGAAKGSSPNTPKANRELMSDTEGRKMYYDRDKGRFFYE